MRKPKNNGTQLKRERKAKGLCTDCGALAVPGKTRCAVHLAKMVQCRLAYRERTKGVRCRDCAHLLNEEVDGKGEIRCVNCRTEVFRVRW